MLSGLPWTQIINDIILWAGFIFGIFGINKKFPFLSKAIDFVKKEEPVIIKEVEAVANIIDKSPAGLAIEHKLKSQVDALSTNVRHAELVKLASVGLHAFGQVLESLSDQQKAALATFVSNSVPKEWGVSVKEVMDAIAEAQNLANDVSKSELFTLANDLTQTIKTMSAQQ